MTKFSLRTVTRITVLLSLLGVITTLPAAEKGWVPEGFKVQKFANPPGATYPVGLAVSPEGEVYVSVDLNSSIDRKPGRGKIIRCVDTDGDGEADEISDFVANIESPRGLCFVGDVLYVVNPPFLTSFRDTTGDGVADEKTELIKGMGFDLSFRGADHTSNGVRQGIDGWLYLAIGDYGMTNAVARDGSSFALRGGGVLRVRPDGSELEPYSLYTRNIYDVGVSPALDVFSRDNTNDGLGWNTRLHHFVALANHGYPRLYKNFPTEHQQPLADYGGGSGTGGYYLDEPGFPDEYNDMFYSLDFTTQHVYAHPMEGVESTFRAEQKPFYSIKAIDMDVDGNSRIYVSDWKDGGYTYGNPSVGSVSLITYPGRTAAKYPNVKEASVNELVGYLTRDSAVLRINAQSEMLRRGRAQQVSSELIKVASDANKALYGRIAVLFTLKQLDGQDANPALVEMTKDPALREYALRALADRKSQIANVPAAPFVAGLGDENPRVRLQSVIGLTRLGAVEHADKILPLAVGVESVSTSGDDRYKNNRAIPHVAVQALAELKAVDVCLAALNSSIQRTAALRSLQLMHKPAVVSGLISQLGSADDSELKAAILGALFRLYHADKEWDGVKWWSTRPDDRGPYFEPIEWSESSRIKSAIEKHFNTISEQEQPDLMVALRRNRMDPSALALNTTVDEVLALIESPTPGSLAIEPLKQAALSGARPAAQRVQAFHALGRIPGVSSFRTQIAVLDEWHRDEPDHPEFNRVYHDFIYSTEHLAKPKMLRDLPRNSRGYSLQTVLMICLNLNASPLANEYMRDLTGKVIASSRKRPEFIRAVGQLRRSDYLPDVELAAKSDKHELALAGREALVQLQSGPKTSTSSKPIGTMEIRDVKSVVMEGNGDVKLGEQLFSQQGCVACHTVSQEQPQKGPFLGDAGQKWKREDLIQSILEPSAVVAQGFQTQYFEMKDDMSYEGFVTMEKENVIELRNVAGVVTRINTGEIAERGTRATSMMPEGLVSNLSLEELSSLVAYLETLK